MYPNQVPVIPEKDLVYSILANEKRVSAEYTTATTESNCPVVRQMFTALLNSTLQIQGQLYQLMVSQGWYNTSSPALQQEVHKQITQYMNFQQETQRFVQRHRGIPMQNPYQSQYAPSQGTHI
jgi:spore coat protein F